MIPDVTLVARAQAGDRAALEALVRRHRSRVELVTLSFFVPGAEREDLKQEAVIALLAAIRDYRPEIGATFASFLQVCVWRHLATCVRTALRGKARPLSESQRLAYEEESGQLVAITEIVPDPRADVHRMAEARAELRRLVDGIEGLTDLERISLVGASFGYSYDEIRESIDESAEISGRFRRPTTFKGADNAIQRARRKLREAA